MDQVSLLPGDAVGGVRADVEARVAALRPAFLRWPGGNVAQDYHWAWGVGPRDRRPVWVNLSWKNEPEPGDIGTDEFIAFCRRVGAEPSITVNVEGRGATAEEAAAWVEYCNGPATSKYGAMRAANGHPEPYGVQVLGDRQRDLGRLGARPLRRRDLRAQLPSATPRPCARWTRDRAHRRRRQRHELEPHRAPGRRPRASTTWRSTTTTARKEMDGRRAQPDGAAALLRAVLPGGRASSSREEAPGRPIRLAINEWGLDLPETRQHSMEAALYGARLMNVFERTSPLVAMSAESDLVNGWPGGIIQASRHGLFVTPLYHVNQLYNAAPRPRPAEDDGRRARRSTRARRAPACPSSTPWPAGPRTARELYVKVVNTSPTSAVDTRIELRGVDVRPEAEWHVLTAPSLEAHNSFATPDAVRPRREVIRAGRRFQAVPASAFRVRDRPPGNRCSEIIRAAACRCGGGGLAHQSVLGRPFMKQT